MTVFADASAIVKLFMIEEATDRVASERAAFAVSALTLVEVTSAIWGKVRSGDANAMTAQMVSNDVSRQFARGHFEGGGELFEIPVGPQVLTTAARLCGVHLLRAGDAIQLATALLVRQVEPSCTRFWVFDTRLADAAAKEGFAVLGPDPA